MGGSKENNPAFIFYSEISGHFFLIPEYKSDKILLNAL